MQLPFRFNEETQKQLFELKEAFKAEGDKSYWNKQNSEKWGIDWRYVYSVSLNKTIAFAIKFAHKKVCCKVIPKKESKK